eukprot:Phypoly_transcript_03359.p1 GENE.Phypoly_transcript_03359~~Phypoly_transcript_03359.p1  ORF type:complete len:770 (+),score=163.92 Phypoly_transcript_03359:74-2383(+)
MVLVELARMKREKAQNNTLQAEKKEEKKEKGERNKKEPETRRRSVSNLEPARVDKSKTSNSNNNLLSLSLPTTSNISPSPSPSYYPAIEGEPTYPTASTPSVESSPTLSPLLPSSYSPRVPPSSTLLRARSQSTTSDDEGLLPPLHGKGGGGGGGCPFMQVRRSSNGEVPTITTSTDTGKFLKSKNNKLVRGSGDFSPDNRSDTSTGSNGTNHLTKLFESETDDSDDDGSYEGMDAAQLKSQLRVLRKINKFTRDIAENSTQAIVVVNAASHKIFWVNGRAQAMFGKLASDMLEQNVNMLIPDEIARKHDRIIDNFMAMWAREGCPPSSKVVNPRAPRDIKAVRFLSDGTRVLFDAQIFVRYVKNGSLDRPPALFVAYLNDITETKELRHQLKLSKVIQEKSAEAIVVCDLFGKITSCNAMMEKMFGYSLSFLIAHNKNIKWFTPKNVAEKHDGYMASFRDNLHAGYDTTKSTIIGKSRQMKGRRPGESEDELFSIVLRVELVGTELVAYIRDVSDSITKEEFDETIAGKVFPRCIKNKVLRNQVDPYEVCEALPTKTIVYTDLVNFSKFSNGTDVMEVYKFINSMYKAFDKIIPQFAGELVKRTGDGIIAMFGIEGKASKHADRAIYACMSMLQWAEENEYKMRVGVATGDVGSGIFGDGESRPAWDVLGECVNLASRMESCGEEGRVQITETTMSYLQDPRLRALFSPRVVSNVKGYGEMKVHLSNPVDYAELQPLLQRRKFEIDHEKKRIMEREKRLHELGVGDTS